MFLSYLWDIYIYSWSGTKLSDYNLLNVPIPSALQTITAGWQSSFKNSLCALFQLLLAAPTHMALKLLFSVCFVV